MNSLKQQVAIATQYAIQCQLESAIASERARNAMEHLELIKKQAVYGKKSRSKTKRKRKMKW